MPARAATAVESRSGAPAGLAAEACVGGTSRPFGAGPFSVRADPALHSALEVERDGERVVLVARSEFLRVIAGYGRAELVCLAELIARGSADPDGAARFSWSDLGRTFGYSSLGARNADLLRRAVVSITTPAIHRRVADLRPIGGMGAPERDTVVGLFAFPPVLRPRGAPRADPRTSTSLVVLEPAYRRLASVLAAVPPQVLLAAPTDAARRLCVVAPYLLAGTRSVEIDTTALSSLLRPSDQKRSRVWADLIAAADFMSSRMEIAVRIAAEAVALERR